MEEKALVIRQEVEKLVDVYFVKQIKFQIWVANPVLVKKSSRKWRICVDFQDLNKAFPKDSYLVPRIN